jgi:hypothetical protein
MGNITGIKKLCMRELFIHMGRHLYDMVSKAG